MSELIEWEKESGVIVKTNDHPANIAFAEERGWKRMQKAKKSAKKTTEKVEAGGDS